MDERRRHRPLRGEPREQYLAYREYIANRNAAVIGLYLSKRTSGQIAKALGMTRGGVAGVLWRSGHWKTGKGQTIQARALGGVMHRSMKGTVFGKRVAPKVAPEPISVGPMPGPDPKPVAIEIPLDRITMAELTSSMCKFPIGNPRGWRTENDDTFHFCGKPMLELGPYCQEHHKLCVVGVHNLRTGHTKPMDRA